VPGAVVLIADDDARRRSTLVETVLRFDPAAAILEARSGEEVIAHITARRPTIGFVGMKLDGLSGPEAIAVARKRGVTIPCLVLVAPRVFPQWQELAQSLNAYEVLKTPLDPDHIGSLLAANARRTTPTPVLLASSSDAARTAVGRVLDRCGFALEVDEADSGRHALKLLRTGGYRLAFIDTNLEGLDGLELACQVQTLNLATHVTVMTTGDPEPIVNAARFFGVDFVMTMPFYARDIDLAIHHALDLRRPYLLHALTAPPAPTALVRVGAPLPARRSA
jgi:DNA-binding NtrC family response regulator